MKIPKLALVFLFAVCVVMYLTYVKHHSDDKNATLLKQALYSPGVDTHLRPTSAEVVGEDFQYGIMFDAGSTGTRIHIFRFLLQPNSMRIISLKCMCMCVHAWGVQ